MFSYSLHVKQNCFWWLLVLVTNIWNWKSKYKAYFFIMLHVDPLPCTTAATIEVWFCGKHWDYCPVFYNAFARSAQSAEMLRNALWRTDRKRWFVVYELMSPLFSFYCLWLEAGGHLCFFKIISIFCVYLRTGVVRTRGWTRSLRQKAVPILSTCSATIITKQNLRWGALLLDVFINFGHPVYFIYWMFAGVVVLLRDSIKLSSLKKIILLVL